MTIRSIRTRTTRSLTSGATRRSRTSSVRRGSWRALSDVTIAGRNRTTRNAKAGRRPVRSVADTICRTAGSRSTGQRSVPLGTRRRKPGAPAVFYLDRGCGILEECHHPPPKESAPMKLACTTCGEIATHLYGELDLRDMTITSMCGEGVLSPSCEGCGGDDQGTPF